jgi:hypothetical protein
MSSGTKAILKPLTSPIPPGELSVIEKSKQLAAWTAVDQHIKPEHRVSEEGYLLHRRGDIDWISRERLLVLVLVSLGLIVSASLLTISQALRYHMSWKGLSARVRRPIKIECSFLRVISSFRDLFYVLISSWQDSSLKN